MPSSHEAIQVAVGVIQNTKGQVLVSRRHPNTHQGGKWEFPGGKCERQEDIQTALKRELYEELGIETQQSKPLITISHQYADKTVILHVLIVMQYQGEPTGREGQPLEWRSIHALESADFPAANRAIITALQLPSKCLVTPDAGDYSRVDFLDKIESAIASGIQLIQLRSHTLSKVAYLELAKSISLMLRECKPIYLQLNMPADWWCNDMGAGLHLTASRSRNLSSRPTDITNRLLSVACHNKDEIKHAESIGADFIFLSPVLPTVSHLDAMPLGWSAFKKLVSNANVPIYALGGLQESDLLQAQASGAQGIAGISGIWNSLA